MKMRQHKMLLFLIGISISWGTVSAQEITIGTPVRGTYQGEKNRARVDFISAKNDLVITENNGEVVEQPVKTSDGNYLYSCICDVIDNNLFGFNISVVGGSEREFVKVYIEEGELCSYTVNVADLPYTIGDVKVNNMFQVIPKDKTAAVTVSTNYRGLAIRSATGEQAQPPVMNETTSLFEFVIYYDLSEEHSDQISRKLFFSVNNGEEVPHELGPLAAKQGVEMAVIVVQESSCYESQITLAKNSFINGLYQQAYNSYNSAFQCKDAPDDRSVEEKNQRTMRTLEIAIKRAQDNFEKAESFRQRNMMDSCMVYHQEAYKYRVAILKVNPSDPYCLEHQRRYDRLKKELPRVLSGRVVNSVKMDARGNNIPLSGIYIVARAYSLKNKAVNGVPVPVIDKLLKEKDILLGRTDQNGGFKVYLPHDAANQKYIVCFTEEDAFTGKSPVVDYTPTEADVQQDIIIKLAPRLGNVNKQKQ